MRGLLALLLLPFLAQNPGPAVTGATASGTAPVYPTVTLSTSNGSVGGSTYVSTASVALSGGNTGDLVACYAVWTANGGAYATVSSLSDGTNSLTALSAVNFVDSAVKYQSGQVFYILSATAPSLTYTATFSALVNNQELVCFDFNASSGTWHYDASNGSSNTNSSAVTTGNVTTTGHAEATLFAGKLFETAATTSSPTIGGTAPSEPSWSPLGTYDHYYFQIETSPYTGQGQKTYSATTNWVANIAAFYAQ